MRTQDLRNITTGLTHTKKSRILGTLQYLTGFRDLNEGQLDGIRKLLLPILKKKIKDPRFWNNELDLDHGGDYKIDPLNEEVRKFFRKKYRMLYFEK